MQHRTFTPVYGILAATLMVIGASSPASAADPTGIWAKDDGTAKMEISKCGSGICSKIVWLRDPKDSRGRPLRDARNENVSLRNRPIIGLPLFSKLTPKAPNSWVGSVYNPEEGRIYTDVSVTLVSSRRIVLKGCRAMLFCGEKSWVKSQLPQQEEASEPKVEQTPVVEASADAHPNPAAVKGAATYVGPGAVAISAGTEPLPLTGENVSSLMVMTNPASVPATPAVPEAKAPAAEETATAEPSAPPTPQRAPKQKSKPQASAPKAKPQDSSPQEVTQEAAATPKAKPKVRQVVQEPQERLPWQ